MCRRRSGAARGLRLCRTIRGAVLARRLHRLDGQIALEQPEPDRARAEACFLKAIDIARSQEARLLELRAATDLARLWRDAGSPNDPRALLEPILAAIEGGEDNEGCPQRPRAAGGDRLIEVEGPRAPRSSTSA